MARCKECRHAEWQRGPSGRILSRKVGKCGFVLKSLPLAPPQWELPTVEEMNRRGHHYGIWVDQEMDCPCFEKIGKSSITLTSPSSGFEYGKECKDCGKRIVDDDDRFETLSRKDNGPVILCEECYRKRGNDVR